MIPRPFEYLIPENLEEALEFLNKHANDAKILAGGHSLVPLMKLRLLSPSYVIDIGRLKELKGIGEEDGRLKVGALTTHHELEVSQLVRSKCPLLSETASHIGDPQVRNAGTIGGALAHADPAGDYGACILALRAEMKAKSVRGERIIRADEFFLDTFATALRPDEILTEIRIPLPRAPSACSYQKLEIKAGDFATVGVAVQLALDGGVVSYVGLGLTAAGPRPMRAKRAEERLLNSKLDDAAIEEASSLAAEEAQPISDLRGSSDYKKAMVKVYTMRALKEALRRAGGG